MAFPADFLWGTSLSAHQAEGNNLNSWTEWERQPGRIKENHHSGSAINHWELFDQDYELLSWLNVNTHRLSVEWSRLEPDQNCWNKKSIQHYRKMIQSLRDRNIKPIVCLFHFTLPLWLEKMGGFENPKSILAFDDFTKMVVDNLGDLVENWLTMNEPAVYALGGYGAGLMPPGLKDLKKFLHVLINLMKAHGSAYHTIKALQPNSQVSFAHHLRVFSPKNKMNPLDLFGTKIADEIFNWSWYQTIQSGKIQIHVPTVLKFYEECPAALGAMDYLGFNYYGRDHISLRPFTVQKIFASTPPSAPKTDMGWEIYPEGIKVILKKIKGHGLQRYPLLITENGIADAGDQLRSQFIFSHMKYFLEGVKEYGLKPMGYLHWAPFDNFEWIDGFGPKFGLFEVDYNTLERRPRPSAFYFKGLGERRTLTAP